MQSQDFITVDECSTNYNIEVSFISSLHESGLVSMTTIDKRTFLHHDQLNDLEKFIRFHYDLEINMEGLETISHLLEKTKNMQLKIVELQNRLKFYEERKLS